MQVISPNGTKNLDILVLSETFFNSKTTEELYHIPGFDLLRKDRNSSGGGILIYANSDLNIKRRTDLEDRDLEALWLQVCPFKSKRPLLLAGIYRPPSAKAKYDKSLADNIERAYLLNMETILVGDFNIDGNRQSDFKKHRLVKALRDTKFVQLVSSVTRPVSNTCLDHIWSNKPDRIINIKTPDICISDHLPVLGVRLYKHCSANNKKH